MAEVNFRSQRAGFVRSEAGSAQISGVLFAIALACTAIVAVLGLMGSIVAPPLIYLVFAVAVVAAGWDFLRERRKGGGR
jgi:mannose/fructose/N-acetylgalactosamine-specific phosphotransferase system component IID